MPRFLLHPFDRTDSLYEIEVDALRSKDNLTLHYSVRGILTELVWPDWDEVCRKDQLWEHTCFEAFLSQPNHLSYWEVNASPAGYWNVYHFDSYRAGMSAESEARMLSVNAEKLEKEFRLSCSFALPGSSDGPLEMNLAAILKFNSGEKHYWASAHHGPKPDFHLRKSFISIIAP